MTGVIPNHKMVPQPVIVDGNAVSMGGRTYTMSKPDSAVRWVVRNGEKVLQQCWSITGQDDNGWNHAYQEWRDVPVEPETK